MSDEESGSEQDSDDNLIEEESNHEVKEEKAEKKKQSIGMSMRKWAMSKTAETKMGRKAIGHFLGDQGVTILSILKSVAVKDAGEAKAKELKRRILKLVLKAKLLVDNKKLQDHDVEHIIEPLNHVLLAFHQRLRMSVAADAAHARSLPAAASSSSSPAVSSSSPTSLPEHSDGRARSMSLATNAVTSRTNQRSFSVALDVGLLVSNMNRIQHMLCTLLKPHISEKNMGKLRQVLGYLSGKPLLASFFNSPAMSPERAGLCVCMALLMEDMYDEMAASSAPQGPRHSHGGALRIYGAEPDTVDRCHSSNCTDQAMPPSPSFPGSKFCVLHYEDQFHALLTAPSVKHFLEEDGTEYTGFATWEGFKLNAPAIKFYQAVSRYRLVTQSIRRIFGDELYEKYLKAGSGVVSEQVPEELRGSIHASLLTHKDQRSAPAVDLFDPAQRFVLAFLEHIFQGFVTSPEFKRYIADKNLIEA